MAAALHLPPNPLPSDGSSRGRRDQRKIPVQFVADVSVYGKGEIAGFSESKAKCLIAAGLAIAYEPDRAKADALAPSERIAVQFLSDFKCYREGEIAGLPRVEAQPLIAAGLAKAHESCSSSSTEPPNSSVSETETEAPQAGKVVQGKDQRLSLSQSDHLRQKQDSRSLSSLEHCLEDASLSLSKRRANARGPPPSSGYLTESFVIPEETQHVSFKSKACNVDPTKEDWIIAKTKPRGPRAKLTREVHERIVSAIRAGNYATVAAEYAGISRATYYRWLQKGSAATKGSFRDLYDDVREAEREAEVRAVALIQKAMGESWQAAMAFLERRYPRRWGRRDHLNVELNPKEVLSELLSLSPEQLDEAVDTAARSQ